MRAGIVFIFILNLFASARGYGASSSEPTVIAVTEKQMENINQKTLYILDKTNTLAIEDILAKPQEWIQPHSDNVAFDLFKTTAWVKLRFENTSDHERSATIELNPVFLEKVQLFDAGGKRLETVGSTIHSDKLMVFPALTLHLQPGVSDYYISIQSRANSLSLILRSDDVAQTKRNFDIAMVASLLGGFAALFIYHLLQFFAYNNRNYLFYSLFIASVALFTLSFTSLHVNFLPSKFGSFHVDFWWSALAAEVMAIFMYFFSADLLGLYPRKEKKLQKLGVALLFFPAAAILTLVFIFATDDPIALVPVRLLTVLQIIVLPTVALSQWARNRSNPIPLFYAISWIPFTVSAALVISWLSGALAHQDIYAWSLSLGAVAQSLFLSLASGLRLKVVTGDKMREQSAKLRLTDELAKKFEQLKSRDRVISSFVSHEIVAELDKGEDPLKYEPRNVEKCIAFLDMRDYTKFSEKYSPMECYEVINEYFQVINQTIYEGGGNVDKIIGDAMMFVFDDPDLCLKAVVRLRRNLSAVNKRRIENNQIPLRFGLGVHYGTMLAANFGSTEKLNRTMVGDTVNVASRLESITKNFVVDVIVSREFVEMHPDYPYFRPTGYVLLKGKAKKSLVFEMFEHNLSEVVEWKLSTKPLLEIAIQLELDEKYAETLALLRSMIDRCPRHTHKPDMIMDPTLLSLVAAVEEKMTQLGLEIPDAEVLQRIPLTFQKVG